MCKLPFLRRLKLNSYLYKFDTFTPKHTLELFDILVYYILNYLAEVYGFLERNQIERVYLQFCRLLLGVKNYTQNNFIYGKLGRISYERQRYFIIVNSDANKMIKHIYNQLLSDMEHNVRKINWAELGFYEVTKYWWS